MQVPLQITMLGIERSDLLEADIRERVAKLERFHPKVMSCRVAVERTRKHHQQGQHFTVRIDVRVPGDEVVVTRDHDEDIHVALRDAFDSTRRRLEEGIREKRGEVKTHEVPKRGKVLRLVADEGFGFIGTADGRELYFSRENLVHPTFEKLEPGAEVQFIEEMAAEGPQAKRVSVGKHGA
jgi:ribosomal subunit interface protein